MIRVANLCLLGFVMLVLTTGCARKGSQSKQINSLQAQVAVITDELVRLDQALQDTRAAVQSESSASIAPSSVSSSSTTAASTIGTVYRTPSGFQLPAVSIQQALRNAGYYSGKMDGKIGSQSEQAVKEFQRDNGLTVDGVVGRNTWAKLKVYLDKSIK